jgi:hypothetical protein
VASCIASAGDATQVIAWWRASSGLWWRELRLFTTAAAAPGPRTLRCGRRA